ncbi:MAG TPA: sugar isomerase, partial [Planctomycetaceae bacterium]|nr:sugar isomerase [Planctomycetaceae bacterium]
MNDLPSSGDPKMKIGLIFLGRKRPGFDMQWGRLTEQRVRERVARTECDVFEPPEKAIDHASLRRAVEACERQSVDAIVLLQATMADGRLAPTAAQLWADPLVLWATPEKPDGDMISSCSLVGTHVWASTLRRMGHPFELVYGDPAEDETGRQLVDAVRLAATVRRLRRLRIGLVGSQAPGFLAMNVDPFSAYRALGVQLQTFSLIEFGHVVDDLPADAVAE